MATPYRSRGSVSGHAAPPRHRTERRRVQRLGRLHLQQDALPQPGALLPRRLAGRGRPGDGDAGELKQRRRRPQARHRSTIDPIEKGLVELFLGLLIGHLTWDLRIVGIQ